MCRRIDIVSRIKSNTFLNLLGNRCTLVFYIVTCDFFKTPNSKYQWCDHTKKVKGKEGKRREEYKNGGLTDHTPTPRKGKKGREGKREKWVEGN